MIKSIEITKIFVSVEKDRKIVALYFEKDLPPIGVLYQKYGKNNIHFSEIHLKKRIYVPSESEQKKYINRRFNKKRAIP